MTGPLDGVRVIEVGGIGPGPFAGMLLADLGAEVIRIDRPGGSLPFPIPPEKDLAGRGKRQVALDLKHPDAVAALLRLVESADALIEGFRPGVAERLGFGPETCLARNPALVYGRMTGWGQDGPWAARAGHDVNYVSMTGALHAIGPAGGPPQIPLNLVGDYGGGALYLVVGLLAGLHVVRAGGCGQVIDAAIVDGTSHLLAGTLSFLNSGLWEDEPGVNLLDGAAPFYGTYATSDGRHFSVGPIEAPFWQEFLARLEVGDLDVDRDDPRAWPLLRERLARVFASRTFAEWQAVFADGDACATPVLSFREAPDHPHIAARGSLTREGGDVAPGIAPRFSVSRGEVPGPAHAPGADTAEVLAEAGLDVDALVASGAAVRGGR